RGPSETGLPPRNRPLPARGGRPPALSRGLFLRGDGRGAGLRHEDDRQRAPTGEEEDPYPPEVQASPPVNFPGIRGIRSDFPGILGIRGGERSFLPVRGRWRGPRRAPHYHHEIERSTTDQPC